MNIRRNSFGLFLLLVPIFVILISSLPDISADVISVNSGGSEQIIVNPDSYIEGFFTGDVVTVSAPVCGNGVIETGEQCDDGNTASGDGCSSTCQTEAVTPPGGGGPSDGGAPTITVSPTEFTIDLAVNTTTERAITITNNGAMSLNVSIIQTNLGNHIILGVSSVMVPAGQNVSLNVIFVALSEPGIFTGTISIGGVLVSVSLNVKTKLLLFDSNIIVLNRDYIVVKGRDLRTRVTLIPLGDKERMDVTLDYTIRDYTGKIYLTQRETLLIEDRINFDRNFGTGSLPIGRYVVGLELKYTNGVAPSSAHFEVVTRAPITFGTIVLWLIMLIIIIGIIVIIIIIYRRRKKKEQDAEASSS